MSARSRIRVGTVLLAAGLSIFAAVPSTNAEDARPRVGLVLGGGAARGFAHLGVLMWLEEHRVPIDVIVGTSIGGLVGGVYASGMSPDEIEALIRDRDWHNLLFPISDYRALPVHQKIDRRRFPAVLSMGIRDGVNLPPGLSRGVFIGLLLSRLTAHVPMGTSFDDLPTPFRCVATDLEEGTLVVLKGGGLSRAMRATMAVPGVFSPIEIDGRILVDGGLIENLPVQTALEMGAEAVIAVDVPPPRHGRDGLRSLAGVMKQTSAIIMERSTINSREAADVLLAPALTGYDPEDFGRAAALADSGYAVAERAREQLLAYAVDEPTYAEHLATRRARRGPDPGRIEAVAVTGLPDKEARQLERRLARRWVGLAFDPDDVARALAGVDASPDVANVHYQTTHADAGWGILVDVVRSNIGPPFIDIGVGTRGSSEEALKVDLAARVTLADPIGERGLIELEARIGSGFEVGAEWTHPVTREAFIAPSVRLGQESPSLYTDGNIAAEAEVRTATFGIDAGVGFEYPDREFRIGVRWEFEDTRRELGELPLLDGTRRRLWTLGRFRFDRLDHPSVPSSGVALTVDGQWFPEVADVSQSTFSAGGDLAVYAPINSVSTWIVRAEAGTAFGESLPLARRFTLGGPFRLSAFVTDELRGSRLVFGSVGYQRQLIRGVPILGGRLFGTVRYAAGGVGDTDVATTAHHSASFGLLMRTAFGPVIATAGIGDDRHATLHLIAGAQFD